MAGQYTKLPGTTFTPSGTQDVNLVKVGGAAISEGQKTMAASLPVVIASDQAMPIPTGAATSANQTTQITAEQAIQVSAASIDTKTPALGQALAAGSTPVVLTAAQVSTLTPLSSVTVTQATGTNLHAVIDSGTTTVTQATGTNLHTVVDSGTITTVAAVTAITNALPAGTNLIGGVAEQKSATSTLSNVASSATSVSLLASAATRKGAMVFNDSTQVLYLKFGTTASTTSYTVQIPPGAYYEFPAFPALYTGAVDGIWTLANGNARITELT